MFAAADNEEGRQAGRQAGASDMPDNVVPITREQSRSRRKRDVRAETISIKRISKREIELGRLLYPADEPLPIACPRTRGECASVPRPCPFVSCVHNLYLDVTGIGSIKMNLPDLDPDEMPAEGSCALDVADDGPHTLEAVGALLNVTRERERQIEGKAFAKLKLAGGAVLREVAEGALDHSRDRVGALDAVMSETGGASEGRTAYGVKSIDEPAFLMRARAYRTYDRRLRERGLVKGRAIVEHDESPSAQTEDAEGEYGAIPLAERGSRHDPNRWTAADDDEVEDWSSDILRALLDGQPLRVALGLYPGRPLTPDERTRMEFRAAKRKAEEREERRRARPGIESVVAPDRVPPPISVGAASLPVSERVFLGALSGRAEAVGAAPAKRRLALIEDAPVVALVSNEERRGEEPRKEGACMSKMDRCVEWLTEHPGATRAEIVAAEIFANSNAADAALYQLKKRSRVSAEEGKYFAGAGVLKSDGAATMANGAPRAQPQRRAPRAAATARPARSRNGGRSLVGGPARV